MTVRLASALPAGAFPSLQTVPEKLAALATCWLSASTVAGATTIVNDKVTEFKDRAGGAVKAVHHADAQVGIVQNLFGDNPDGIPVPGADFGTAGVYKFTADPVVFSQDCGIALICKATRTGVAQHVLGRDVNGDAEIKVRIIEQDGTPDYMELVVDFADTKVTVSGIPNDAVFLAFIDATYVEGDDNTLSVRIGETVETYPFENEPDDDLDLYAFALNAVSQQAFSSPFMEMIFFQNVLNTNGAAETRRLCHEFLTKRVGSAGYHGVETFS